MKGGDKCKRFHPPPGDASAADDTGEVSLPPPCRRARQYAI